MLGAAIVHPNRREVIPLCPEMIIKQDGKTKQDCEREAAKRFLRQFRLEHPHLKCLAIEDRISSNGPHVNDLINNDLRFILGAKPGDHVLLFERLDQAVKDGVATEFSENRPDCPETTHYYRFVNGASLNKSHPDILVNVLDYWQID